MPRSTGGERRLSSWTGAGEISIDPGRGERSAPVDVVLAICICLGVDAVAFGATFTFASRGPSIVCGARCFANPQITIHDGLVTLISFGIAVLGSIAASLITRWNRIPVLVVQAGVTVFVLISTLPGLATAYHRQHTLIACRYGHRLPCPGVRNLGPAFGT